MPRSSRQVLRGLVLLVLACVFQANAASPRIAVLPFDARQVAGKLSGEQLADYVTDELVNLQVATVVEREKLRAIREEIDFSASGLVARDSVVRMGKLLGASHLLSGRIISIESASTELNSSYGVTGRNQIWELSIAIRIYAAESGEVVYSDRARARKVVRTSPQTRISTDAPYAALAEAAAVEVVAGIRDAAFVLPAETPGAMVAVPIESIPPGADVEVDGLFIGNTDGSYRLSRGVHVIRISRGGLAWEKRVDVQPGLRIQAHLD